MSWSKLTYGHWEAWTYVRIKCEAVVGQRTPAKIMWPHASQTTSEFGLRYWSSGLIQDAYGWVQTWTYFWPLVIGSLWTIVNMRCERDLGWPRDQSSPVNEPASFTIWMTVLLTSFLTIPIRPSEAPMWLGGWQPASFQILSRHQGYHTSLSWLGCCAVCQGPLAPAPAPGVRLEHWGEQSQDSN